MSTAVRVNVGTTAKKLTGAFVPGGATQALLVQALDGDVFLGGSDVTATAGYPLRQGEQLGGNAASHLWAVAAAGTIEVAVLRQLSA